MPCAQYRESIHDLLDGTIGLHRRAELDRHVAQCDACRAFASDLQAIQDAAAMLPSIEPPDRLWLQIAGRLRQEGRVTPLVAPAAAPAHHLAMLALAATLVVAIGASIVMLLPQFRANNSGGSRLDNAEGAQPGPVRTDDLVQSVAAEFRLAEQHYQNAIAKLEQVATLDPAVSGSASIDPGTAAMLQKNLRVIDQAIAESRAALRTEPQSAPARDSLFDALRRKVALLQDTIALMNEMRKGNSAGAMQLVDDLNKSPS